MLFNDINYQKQTFRSEIARVLGPKEDIPKRVKMGPIEARIQNQGKC